MKIYNKTILTGLALTLSLGFFTSCDDDTDYKPGEVVDGAQAYFPSSEQTQYSLSSSATTFSVVVSRASASDAISVPISVTPQPGNTANDAFTFPSSVSFNSGEKTANFVVTYDLSMIEYDENQQFELVIDDASSTPYGSSAIVITAVYSSPWTLLGTGTYTDEYDWVNEEEGPTTHVQFYRNDLDPNLYRVNNPYSWPTNETPQDYFQFRLLQPGETYLNQVVPDNGITIVAYSDFVVEYNTTYNADMYLLFPGRLTSLTDPSNWVYNYVVDFQENGLPGEIHLSPMYYMFDVGGFNQTTSEPITMIFPGYNPVDASVEVTYNGMLTKPDETREVIAYVELGADVTEAKVAVVPGNSPSSAALEGIQNGSIESQSITVTGQVNIPFDAASPEGKYSVVAVSYYGDEARSYGSASFSYTPGTPETWSLVGTGLYTYLDFWVTNLGLEPEVLELYESDTTPGKFKITHWMNNQDFKFTVDEDGTIYVDEEQETGVTSGGNMIYVDDATLWGLDAPSYLEDGTYHFSVIYYDEGGYYAYGYETFEPSTANAASLSTRSTNLKIQKGKTVKLNKRVIRNASLNKHSLQIESLN